jgi:hypothetical protein
MNTKHYTKQYVGAVLVGGILMASQLASANSVSYVLDVPNIAPVLPSGTPYLHVTIDDMGAPGDINFTVETVYPFDEGTNFGIQSFGFNNTLGENISLTAANLSLPSDWGFFPDENQNGFGNFEFTVTTPADMGMPNRQDPLMFSITGIANDSIASYTGASTGNAEHGNAWFAAHVADFGTGEGVGGCDLNEEGCDEIRSGWFGGGDGIDPPAAVPVPAAVWLFGSGLIGLAGIARRRRKA